MQSGSYAYAKLIERESTGPLGGAGRLPRHHGAGLRFPLIGVVSCGSKRERPLRGA